MTKLIFGGWGIEFGRYYCGGAPEGWRHRGLGNWSYEPAVPVSWSWGIGFHWKSPANMEYDRTEVREAETSDGSWWWRRRWFYGKSHNCDVSNVPDQTGRDYLDSLLSRLNP